MIIPFIDSVLNHNDELPIGGGLYIIRIPPEHMRRLSESKEIVANYENSLGDITVGLKFNQDESPITKKLTINDKTKISIFASMLIRLVTAVPIDMPFWIDLSDDGDIKGLGQTRVRTYRVGRQYTYVLDEGFALERLNKLSNGVERLLTLLVTDKNKNRIIRAVEFVSIGYQTFFIPSRMVNQVTFLETLFTTSRSEITFQLASRISWYLSGIANPTERENNFDLIKDIYNARSRIVHGEHTNDPKRNLNKWLNEAEHLNTAVFNAILQNNHIDAFSMSEKRREKEFKKLTLGIPCEFMGA